MTVAPSSDRVLQARLAARTRWAATADRPAATAPARAAFEDRFHDQVDPEGILDPRERAIRAEHARKAYFAALALRSAQARRRAREATTAADAIEAEMARATAARLTDDEGGAALSGAHE